MVLGYGVRARDSTWEEPAEFWRKASNRKYNLSLLPQSQHFIVSSGQNTCGFYFIVFAFVFISIYTYLSLVSGVKFSDSSVSNSIQCSFHQRPSLMSVTQLCLPPHPRPRQQSYICPLYLLRTFYGLPSSEFSSYFIFLSFFYVPLFHFLNPQKSEIIWFLSLSDCGFFY